MYTLLYVEDEPAIAKGVIRGLEAEGYEVVWAESAEDGCRLLQADQIHLILLDVRLPNMDGFSFCRSVRAEGITIPIIMLTARDEEVDRVLGLELGADDYLVKPFSLRELISRVRSQIRRAYGEFAAGDQPSGNSIIAGPIRIDRHSLRVFRDEREVHLTPIELKALLCLVENAGTTLTRPVLIEAVWGEGYFLEEERTVDVHIRHLREKIETDPARPELIQTVRGYGYRYVAKP
jgi:DNA-binding response OmpR family regulator